MSDAAVRHLERALAADERVSRTVQALRELRRWRAAVAWSDALGEAAPARPAAPALALVDSSATSAADRLDAARGALLRDADVVGYELYEWWGTLRHGDADDLASHYAVDAVRETPAPDVAAALPDWEDVDSDVAFTATDAVAVLRWTEGDAPSGRLLLLRAVDDRWLIYRETVL